MKITNLSVLLFLVTTSFLVAQNYNCVPVASFKSDADLVEIKNLTDSRKQKLDGKYNLNGLKLTVFADLMVTSDSKSTYSYAPQNGYHAELKNKAGQNIHLPSYRGRIEMKRQAFINNQWEDVRSFDRRPRGVCGTGISSTSRTLEQGKLLRFFVPCIDGDFPVKFRLVLSSKKAGAASPTIYSNVFEGYISKELLN